MTNLTDQIKNKLRSANIVEQLIYANIVVFMMSYIIKAIALLMNWHDNLFYSWFALPDNFNMLLLKPWTIISYSFLHGGFWHIFFNMLVLYYIGSLFLDFFSKRDFLIYYFLGVIFGGLVFMLSYSYFPALKTENANLVGASAGVTAILVGIATKIPNYAMHFRFIGAIKLWYIAAGFILLSIMQMSVSNTGGNLAHLGGALIGFLLTNQADKWTNVSQLITNLTNPKKKNPLKTVYKKSNQKRNQIKNKDEHQKKVDEILDKISKSGYDTLSQEEKDFLFTIGKK